jgi:hypothetical protein
LPLSPLRVFLSLSLPIPLFPLSVCLPLFPRQQVCRSPTTWRHPRPSQPTSTFLASTSPRRLTSTSRSMSSKTSMTRTRCVALLSPHLLALELAQVDVEALEMDNLWTALRSTPAGLTTEEVDNRLELFGKNMLETKDVNVWSPPLLSPRTLSPRAAHPPVPQLHVEPPVLGHGGRRLGRHRPQQWRRQATRVRRTSHASTRPLTRDPQLARFCWHCPAPTHQLGHRLLRRTWRRQRRQGPHGFACPQG